jgi:hypothetical protein
MAAAGASDSPHDNHTANDSDANGDATGSSPSYLLHCERSSGQYLFDALLRAGADFGIEIDGFRPPGI